MLRTRPAEIGSLLTQVAHSVGVVDRGMGVKGTEIDKDKDSVVLFPIFSLFPFFPPLVTLLKP